MTSKVAALIGATALVAVSAGPASAAPSGANGCIGAASSLTAHLTQQHLDEGFGAASKSLGLNPGRVIKAYEAETCDA
jgi:ABC-type molybdate transport system substrate-binding protein